MTIDIAAPGDDEVALQQALAALVTPSMPWVSGRFYAPTFVLANSETTTDEDYLFALPIYVPNDVSIANLFVLVGNGAAAAAARVGVYKDADGYPGALVAEANAPIDLEGSGEKSGAITGCNLTPGWHWLACVVDGAAQLHSLIQSEHAMRTVGAETSAKALAQTAAQSGVAAVFTYGALPATFPAGGLASFIVGTACPVIAVEVA